MGLLRSNLMQRGTIVLARESAREVVNSLGHDAKIQFEDTFAGDIGTQRLYRTNVQRIEECERIIRFLFEEVAKHTSDIIVKSAASFLNCAQDEYRLDDVERQLKTLYKHFTQFRDNNAALQTSYNEMIEAKYVVEFGYKVVYASDLTNSDRSLVSNMSDEAINLLASSDTAGGTSSFNNVAGTVAASDQARFERFLFRSSRGNSFTHFHDIPEMLTDPISQKPVRKCAFVVYFQGLRAGDSIMNAKIRRACDQFGANIYPWISSRSDAERSMQSLTRLAEEKLQALSAYESFVQSEQRLLVALGAGGNSVLEEWRLFCLKEKGIYMTLNKFQGHSTTLRCTAWFPENEEMAIRELLQRNADIDGYAAAGNTSSGSYGIGMMSYGSNNMLVVDHAAGGSSAPTYFRSNDLLAPFQKLVNTYGVPRYQEATPVLFTIVTFPFIFGIMFGDVGHGTLLLIVGIWACTTDGPFLQRDNPALYMARYMLAMMGFFALYAGLLYSDLFSVGLDLFGSRWICEEPGVECTAAYDIKNGAGAVQTDIGPYPFGLDPAWHGSVNELLFVNSLKMKLSVIMGVTQMIVGLVLRFSNSIFERNYVDFVFECVPMLVFMLCFFGFMDYLIFYKWVTPLDKPPFNNPPSIINSMIAMAMWQTDQDPMWEGYDHHAKTLLTISLVTIPLILIPKPFILWLRRPRHDSHIRLTQESESDGRSLPEEPVPPFDIADIAIHQVIETIEYVLGTVSHTASYLRLWALSLAHQQLSAVFFEYTLGIALLAPFPLNAVKIYVAFAVWFAVTLGILMGMDTLECFLHALRLHWVEFQSKFFRADGKEFSPYRHISILEPDDE